MSTYMEDSEISENKQLKRSLGLPLLLSYGIGNILGAGIYVLVGEVVLVAGMYAPIAFLVAAFIALFSGLSYAELSARYPLSAGEAVYIDEAFGIKRLSIFIGLLVCASGIISSATLVRGFVGYLDLFIELPEVLSIVLLLLALGGVAIVGITHSVVIAAFFTVLEVVGLLLILWVTRQALAELPERWALLLPPMKFAPWPGIVAGAFLSFFAFIGFEDMVNVAEEVKNPRRTIPIAIILAIFICSILYALIALAAVMQVPLVQLGNTEAPLALVFETATGKEPVLLGYLSLFAIVNGVLIQIIMVSRIVYGMANRQLLPKVLGAVNSRFRTPMVATILVVFIILILSLFFPLRQLASATSTIVLLIFVLINTALIVIKTRDKKSGDNFSVSIWIPGIGLIMSLALTISGAIL